jgi:hypothetical protein
MKQETEKKERAEKMKRRLEAYAGKMAAIAQQGKAPAERRA